MNALADPEGANPAMALPIEVANGVWPPLGAEKVMIGLNMSKSKDFGPRIDVDYRFGPPAENSKLKHSKGSMTKKKVNRNLGR